MDEDGYAGDNGSGGCFAARVELPEIYSVPTIGSRGGPEKLVIRMPSAVGSFSASSVDQEPNLSNKIASPCKELVCGTCCLGDLSQYWTTTPGELLTRSVSAIMSK